MAIHSYNTIQTVDVLIDDVKSHHLVNFGLGLCSLLQYRKMSRKSFEGNDSNVNRLEHYKNVLAKLLPEKGDSFCKGVSNEAQGTDTQSKEGHVCNRALPLFAEQISGLSKNDKEGIKYTLHEIITILNDDLDEV